MKKGVLALFVISLLLLTTFSSAAGTSTRDRNTTQNQTSTQNPPLTGREQMRARILANIQAQIDPAGADISCEYSKPNSLSKTIPNISRLLRKNGSRARHVSREKAQIRSRLESAPEEYRRSYAVLLLYALQERVEHAQESGRLTQEQAADIITKIVETKQSILKGESKAAIQTHLQELRAMWQPTQ